MLESMSWSESQLCDPGKDTSSLCVIIFYLHNGDDNDACIVITIPFIKQVMSALGVVVKTKG